MPRAHPLLLASLLVVVTVACSSRGLADGDDSEASTSAGVIEPAPADPGGPLSPASVALRMASALCEADATCGGCSGAAPLESCVDIWYANFQARVDVALSLGLSFDAECASALLDYYTSVGCEAVTPTHIEEKERLSSCDLFVGTKSAGEPCDLGDYLSLQDPDLDPCAPGLRCSAGTCVVPAGPGEVCRWPEDTEFGPPVNYPCDETSYCHERFECRARAQVGAPCDPYAEDVGWNGRNRSCVAGAYCDDQTALCVPTRAAGEPCNLDDMCPLRCGHDGVCEDVALSCAQALYDW